MSIIVYNKLVRDRIPEIIEASGKTCKTEILPDDEYLKMIDAKLDEELAEYHKDQNIEELADCILRCTAAAGAVPAVAVRRHRSAVSIGDPGLDHYRVILSSTLEDRVG